MINLSASKSLLVYIWKLKGSKLEKTSYHSVNLYDTHKTLLGLYLVKICFINCVLPVSYGLLIFKDLISGSLKKRFY